MQEYRTTYPQEYVFTAYVNCFSIDTVSAVLGEEKKGQPTFEYFQGIERYYEQGHLMILTVRLAVRLTGYSVTAQRKQGPCI